MRNALHIIASLAMWCLFGYYWYVVLVRQPDPNTLRSVVILAIVVLAGLLLTVLWVRHNLKLARRFANRRRQTPVPATTPLELDTIGRPVTHPGLDVLRAARVVDVTADASAKTFTVADGRRSG
ncbi:hypothetical protein GF314_02785 [bacterium]|nr:hypothetical protein [bacterium]